MLISRPEYSGASKGVQTAGLAQAVGNVSSVIPLLVSCNFPGIYCTSVRHPSSHIQHQKRSLCLGLLPICLKCASGNKPIRVPTSTKTNNKLPVILSSKFHSEKNVPFKHNILKTMMKLQYWEINLPFIHGHFSTISALLTLPYSESLSNASI